MNSKKKLLILLSSVLVLVLLAAAALYIKAKDDAEKDNAAAAGSKQFTLTVTDYDGSTTEHSISTDADTVGAALLEQGLVEGEEGPYGLYIKTVNGIRADYELDGHYWAFYINGEYALTGIDQTPVEPGTAYELRVE